MKRICLIFGHHNTKNSFNAAIRDAFIDEAEKIGHKICLLYTSPSPRDRQKSRMPSSA